MCSSEAWRSGRYDARPEHAVHGGRAEHDERECPAVARHHDQDHDRRGAIDHRFQKPGRQGALDDAQGFEARDDVSQVAALEEADRQPQQLTEQSSDQGEIERGGEHHHRPAAQRAHAHLRQREQQESHCEHGQQIAVFAHQRLIDDRLHEERRDDAEHFEHGGERQNLTQRAAGSRQPADELRQARTGRRDLRLELLRRRQLERDAGEVARQLPQRHRTASARGVVNHRPVTAQPGQNHEVVEIPMQHRRKAELVDIRQFQLERAGTEVEALGDLDQMRERGALQRNRKAIAQACKIAPMAMKGRHHREARQAAFGGFGLQNDRHGAAPGEIQRQVEIHAVSLAQARRGRRARATARTATRPVGAGRARCRRRAAFRPAAESPFRRREPSAARARP